MPIAQAMPESSSVLPFPPRPVLAPAEPADAPILLSPPQLTGREIASLTATLQSGWVAPARAASKAAGTGAGRAGPVRFGAAPGQASCGKSALFRG